MGLQISLASTSFPRSLEFVPASDPTIADWYVLGDRSGGGSLAAATVNQAAGGAAPTITGGDSIIVNDRSIVIHNLKSEIVSNLPGNNDLTCIAVVYPNAFNSNAGVIPFGTIGTHGGFTVQANALSATTYRWESYVANSGGGLGLLGPRGETRTIGSAPVLVAITQVAATKTLTFYDLTNNAYGSYSQGAQGTAYAPVSDHVLVGSSYGAQAGGAPATAAELAFWASFQRALTQPQLQDMAARVRRVMLNAGVVVG